VGLDRFHHQSASRVQAVRHVSKSGVILPAGWSSVACGQPHACPFIDAQDIGGNRVSNWFEVGKERFKVRGESLEGSERTEALARTAAISRRSGIYQERIDREIPILRLTRGLW